MHRILRENNTVTAVDKVYNFTEESKSSKFYDELFSATFEKKELPSLYKEVKKTHQEKGDAYKIMGEIISFLEKKLPKDAFVIELGGGVFQHRAANVYQRFENYFPVDISYSSIKRYCETFDREGIVGDAKNLPFKDNSIDCIFTHTFLEHPLEPEKVLSEITRVLKVGGIIIHNDAWFCRWWQRFGIVGLKPFNDMSIKEKTIYIFAKISEISVFRIPPIIVKRLIKHLFVSTTQPIPFSYTKLNPNYELHLGCDEDAANAMDPIDAIRFYESRGFELITNLSLKQRLFYPNKYIALRKVK